VLLYEVRCCRIPFGLIVGAGLAHTSKHMSQDEFTKLFTYMEQRFDALEAKIDDKADKKQVDSLIGLVDTIAKNQEPTNKNASSPTINSIVMKTGSSELRTESRSRTIQQRRGCSTILCVTSATTQALDFPSHLAHI
jgi:tryptophan synthase alpha subunit